MRTSIDIAQASSDIAQASSDIAQASIDIAQALFLGALTIFNADVHGQHLKGFRWAYGRQALFDCARVCLGDVRSCIGVAG